MSGPLEGGIFLTHTVVSSLLIRVQDI